MANGDAKYLLERAESCFQLARSMTDPEMTEKLKASGRQFMNRAAAINAEQEAENGRLSAQMS
jgi:hypothetical protein